MAPDSPTIREGKDSKAPKPKRITLAFSSHRAETLPFAARHMRRNEVIVLEEPRNSDFEKMISETLSIDEYLGRNDFEFPLFTRRSCELLRELARQGKTILQVDPYMEILEGIHDFFERGGKPEEMEPGSRRHTVYQAERRWTGALLGYYEKSASDRFRHTVASVKAFARADAARGAVRDEMRGQKIASLLSLPCETMYIEAGYIHLALLRELRHQLPAGALLRPVYLMEQVVRPLTGKRQVYVPGDRLTFLYTFRPGYAGKKADLLAARSLIHVKILQKEEFEENDQPYPHTLNEIESNRLVENLPYETCRVLYGKIRSKRTEEARDIVRQHVATR